MSEKMLPGEMHIVPMQGGGQVALHRMPALAETCVETRTNATPVLIAHGTLSNRQAVEQVGVHLAQRGHDVWFLEWGGHGHARCSKPRQNFEFPAFADLPAAIEFVLQASGKPRLHWVSHSGGGLLALMLLARQPHRQAQFKSLVLMGAQVTHAAPNLKQKIRVATLGGLTTLFGKTPRRLVPIGPEGEPSPLLAQWAWWNLRGRWLGADNFDYLEAIREVDLPCLVFAGGGDTVAPLLGCRTIFDALGGQKDWVACSVNEGFSKDFSHSQMIRGEAARKEVFPRLHAFIEQADDR